MAIRQEILDMTEVISKAVLAEKIYLFGSYANGTPRADSDYDFFVVVPDGGPRPLEVIQTARKSLSKANRQTSVDILDKWEDDYKTRKAVQ